MSSFEFIETYSFISCLCLIVEIIDLIHYNNIITQVDDEIPEIQQIHSTKFNENLLQQRKRSDVLHWNQRL